MKIRHSKGFNNKDYTFEIDEEDITKKFENVIVSSITLTILIETRKNRLALTMKI